jgi:hypothetical protein
MLTAISQRFSRREMSVREKGLWAQALKALDDARLSGEIQLRVGVQIDVVCCDEMLHDAVAAGCRYNDGERLSAPSSWRSFKLTRRGGRSCSIARM